MIESFWGGLLGEEEEEEEEEEEGEGEEEGEEEGEGEGEGEGAERDSPGLYSWESWWARERGSERDQRKEGRGERERCIFWRI